jgi:hypothetical protein
VDDASRITFDFPKKTVFKNRMIGIAAARIVISLNIGTAHSSDETMRTVGGRSNVVTFL